METVIRFSSAPYPGLRPFRYDESDIFFGREQQTDQLLARLSLTRFLAVTGASGCGKSSLVRAGMIPALRAGFMADVGSRWRIIEMHPGSSPLSQLARALCDPAIRGEQNNPEESLAILDTTLRRGPLGLIEIARGTEALHGKALLVLVDQFEELFRFRDQIAFDEADAFVALLLACAAQRDVEIYVVITMRSDYLGRCPLFQGLAEAVSEGQYLTPRLTRDELEQAITRPARTFGGSIAPALVNRLLNDFGTDPDQLPVLQHALMRMWARCKPAPTCPPLTVADYDAIGGLSNALSNHADEAFAELTADQQRVAEVMFKRLSGSETGPRDVRSPARVSEVAAIAAVGPGEVAAVLEAFRRQDRCFLLVQPVAADDQLIDISHESLIRQWRRLKTWAEEESQAAVVYRRIRDWALRWREGKAELWRGPDLATALASRDGWPPNPQAWAARYGGPGEFQTAIEFLDASLQAERTASELERAARRRQLRRARQLAVGCALAALLLAAGIIAYWVGFRLEHSSYFKSYVKVYGVPKGIDPLTERQVRQRADSLRITTRGRLGNQPVIRMESVDAAGHVSGSNDVATGFTSATGAADEARWEYVYDQAERIAAEVAFDRDGKRVRSTIYSPYDSADGHHRSAYVIDATGSLAPQSQSCSTFVRIDYTKVGYEERVHYLDRAGNPTPGRDGVYMAAYEYDAVGRQTSLISEYRDGRRMNDHVGNAVMRTYYGDSGDLVRGEAFDAAGAPVNITDGWQTMTRNYDLAGNVVDYFYQAADGRPAKDGNGCAALHVTLDDAGRALVTECRDEHRRVTPTPSGFASWKIGYDDSGRPAEYQYFDTAGRPTKGPDGAFREVNRYDPRGHVVEVSFQSADGGPMAGTDGYQRIVSTFAADHEIKTEYLDRDGRPALIARANYSAIARRFDGRGNEILHTYLGPDGQAVQNESERYAGRQMTYDACGRETETRYLNKDGGLLRLPAGYAVLRREFDADNRVAALSYLDERERAVRTTAGYARMTRRFNRNGQLVEESYFDERGALLPLTGGFATLRRDYDDHNFIIDESYFGVDGKPVASAKSHWARVTYVRDARGNATATAYFGVDGRPLMLKIGYASTTDRFDGRGKVVEEAYFGVDGKPVVTADGWARITYVNDDSGRAIERAHFGAHGEPVLGIKVRYHRATRTFDETGNVSGAAYFGTDGKPIELENGSRRCASYTGPFDDPKRSAEVKCYNAAGKLVP